MKQLKVNRSSYTTIWLSSACFLLVLIPWFLSLYPGQVDSLIDPISLKKIKLIKLLKAKKLAALSMLAGKKLVKKKKLLGLKAMKGGGWGGAGGGALAAVGGGAGALMFLNNGQYLNSDAESLPFDFRQFTDLLNIPQSMFDGVMGKLASKKSVIPINQFMDILLTMIPLKTMAVMEMKRKVMRMIPSLASAASVKVVRQARQLGPLHYGSSGGSGGGGGAEEFGLVGSRLLESNDFFYHNHPVDRARYHDNERPYEQGGGHGSGWKK